MSTGRVPVTLSRDCCAAPESFTGLGIVQDRGRTVDGVVDFDIPAFRCRECSSSAAFVWVSEFIALSLHPIL